jgi:hypothetical protein
MYSPCEPGYQHPSRGLDDCLSQEGSMRLRSGCERLSRQDPMQAPYDDSIRVFDDSIRVFDTTTQPLT